jgi:uncharacterized iron-regulated membrane protein
MAFVLLTGTLATVSPELDWLSTPAKRATSTAAAGNVPWGAMLADFQRRFPEAQASVIDVPTEGWFAPELIAVDADGERFRVFFDRASGTVQGTGRWLNWQRFLREAHRHLVMPIEVGLTIVGLLGIPLLVTFWSSLYVYKRWWRGFFRLPRRGAAGQRTSVKSRRRFWGDLHRLAGVWSLWFVLLMAVTGIWYLVEHLGLNATLPALEEKPAASAEAPRLLDRNPLALDALLSRAAREYPGLRVRSVFLDLYDGAVVVQGQADAVLVRDRANHVAFDGVTGRLLDIRQGETLDWHNRISEAADPLHFGDFAGAATRYLWAVFGAFMTLLSLSGVYLYGLRSVATLRRPAERVAAVWRTALGRIPRRYLLPQGLLVAACLVLASLRYLVL